MNDTDKTKKQLIAELEELRASCKKREEALKKSKDRLSKTMMAANDGMWDWDLKTDKVFYDARYYQMAGYDVDEFPHRLEEFQKRIHPDDTDFVMNQAQKHLNGETDRFIVEFRFKKKTGDWLWIKGRGLIVERDQNNKPLRFIGTHTDITKRKQAEEALKEKETFLKTIFDGIQEPMHVIDRDYKVLLTNKKLLEMKNVNQEDVRGKYCYEAYQGHNEHCEQCGAKEVFKTGKPYFMIKSIPLPDETYGYFEVYSFPLSEESGEVAQVIEMTRDITDRKRAEEELAAEKERLAVTLRSIGDGVITTDIEGKIVLINKVAEDLTGWSNEDAKGKFAHEVFTIVNEKTGQKCASPVSRVLEHGRIVGLANHTALITKNGAQISIADSGAPIRDAESKIFGVVIVFRDVTHERRIEEELLRTRKLESVGVLAGGIAHDFNNILAAISGNIELASLRIEDDNVGSLLSSAKQATKRATKLTQQLLTFSKGGDPVKEKTSLRGLIQESADFVLHGSKVGCEYSYPDDLWMVDADSGQLGQVIQNITINAMQAMPEGGKIQIDCGNIEDVAAESLLNIHDGNFVRIRIQDTGIGIPKEIIDKIFDPYYSTKQQGSGLGLAICHSIINKHDGHISVRSTPGKGTIFTIYLPAVSLGGTTAPKATHTSSPVRAARIMVMDDEEMIRDLVKAQLTALGHEAVVVADGEQAINEYQRLQDSGTPVDLVIMDLTIPGGMGGQEAARRLLQIDPQAKMIVASGYSNDPVMADCREYGFRAAVAKPFDLPELSRGIESALS